MKDKNIIDRGIKLLDILLDPSNRDRGFSETDVILNFNFQGSNNRIAMVIYTSASTIHISSNFWHEIKKYIPTTNSNIEEMCRKWVWINTEFKCKIANLML